jgi:hypothetical protein
MSLFLIYGTCRILDKVKGSFWSMQNFISCIRYNKSLTITNIQLIITKIRFSMCRTGNVWSNMLIRTCIREPSDRI